MVKGSVLTVLLTGLIGAIMVACVTVPPNAAGPTHVTAGDLAWLNRVTYGINARSEAEYLQRGRAGYLEWQLAGGDPGLPPAVAQMIAALEVTRSDPLTVLTQLAEENRRIAALPEGPEREQARKVQRDRAARLANEAQQREILRALYDPAQLREQMVGFWLNHFSVFQGKGDLRWLVGDYAEHAIRPHALGRFRDLVMAPLMHPAMLQYLDNAQNAAGHINENYARELMELHTLGVDGGYSQQDVQALARILTGVGVTTRDSPPKLKKEWQGLYHRDGVFEFNPARHDFGEKVFLGHAIVGSGFDEVAMAVDLLTESDACARFISRQLAHYFVSDSPSPALVERLSHRFHQTHGDIAALVRTLIQDPEFTASLGRKFKDPQHFVISALRLAYNEQPVTNLRPVLNWLGSLGQAPFGRQTPDGYPLDENGWASSGQLSRRFEIARAIGGGGGLFDPESGSVATAHGFPRLASALYFSRIEPTLSASTRAALDNTASQQEWNTVLLASPEFNYR